MRLKFVKLTHFRGYRATTVISIGEAMTGIVGLYQAAQTAY
jgi:chromosome segregation ATPase